MQEPSKTKRSFLQRLNGLFKRKKKEELIVTAENVLYYVVESIVLEYRKKGIESAVRILENYESQILGSVAQAMARRVAEVALPVLAEQMGGKIVSRTLDIAAPQIAEQMAKRVVPQLAGILAKDPEQLDLFVRAVKKIRTSMN